MSIGNDHDDLQGAILALQILMAALAWIAISFMALVLFLLFERSGLPAVAGRRVFLGVPFLTLTATGLSTGCLAAWHYAPRLVVDGKLRELAARKQPPAGAAESRDGEASAPAPTPVPPPPLPADGELLALFQVQFILGAALTEGGALYALLVYLLEHHYLSLAAAFTLLAALFARFPTVGRARAWIDEKRSAVVAMRSTLDEASRVG